MWKRQDDEEEEKKKPVEKQWFKTTVKMEKDMEVFETQEVDSDEQDDDSLIGSDVEDGDQEKKVKAPKVKKEPIQTEAGTGEDKPDYGHLV